MMMNNYKSMILTHRSLLLLSLSQEWSHFPLHPVYTHACQCWFRPVSLLILGIHFELWNQAKDNGIDINNCPSRDQFWDAAYPTVKRKWYINVTHFNIWSLGAHEDFGLPVGFASFCSELAKSDNLTLTEEQPSQVCKKFILRLITGFCF